MRTFAIAVAVIAGGTLALPTTVGNAEVDTAPSTAGTLPASVADAEFRVGPPEIVANGHSRLDGFFNVVNVGGIYRGYIGNHQAMRYEGASLENLRLKGTYPMGLGDRDKFDECGALIYAVAVDPDEPGILRAWYHAEQKDEADDACDYSSTGPGQTHKSIAYAQSVDGGLTYTKPGYPNNQVVTRFEPLLPNREPGIAGKVSGRGDFSVVRSDDFYGGDYYYLYYLDNKQESGVMREYGAVARAEVSTNGVPGSWTNYDGGSWSVNALDGDAAPLGGTAMSSASIYLQAGEVVRVRQPKSLGGLVMNYGSGPVGYAGATEPLVYLSTGDYFDSVANPGGQRLLYSSIVGPSGLREWNDSFYLFSVYGFPGDDGWADRYLVRRKVEVLTRPSGGPQTKLALSLYESKNASRADLWTTSGVAPVTHQYVETTGYILTSGGANRLLLTDCAKTNGEHYLSTTNCANETEHLRDLGFVFNYPEPGTVQLKVCETQTQSGIWTGDRYATTGSCRTGFGFRWYLGWVYPAVGDEDGASLRVDRAGEMFSGHQEFQRWSYRDGSNHVLKYDSVTNWWFDAASSAKVRPTIMNPGDGAAVVRRWAADTAARLRIRSILTDVDPSCGSGVRAKIIHRGADLPPEGVVLFDKELQNSFSGVAADSEVIVSQGDWIDFRIVPISTNGSCDRTTWNPSIEVVP